jgi:hypothetical protein
MPLQRFTMGRMPGLAKVVRSTIAMLRFPRVVRCTTVLTASLISKQVVPYQTHGGTCCPGGILLRTDP